jgi:hypothetical protein
LLHPFFKQSKRKDYLVKTILYELPPLEQRPRKKIIQKQVTITKTDEWDFDDDNDTEQDDDDDDETELLLDNNNIIIPLNQQQLQENNTKKTTRKHISFGDVVVRSNNNNNNNNSNSNSMIHPSETSPVGTPPRKSRFVIEETSRDYTDTFNSSPSVRSSSPMLEDDHDSNNSGEVMKGRFYVNQNNNTTSSTSKHPTVEDNEHQQQQLHKMPSQDTLNMNNGDRKSRFEISNNSSSSPLLYQPIPLSRDSSSYSSSSTSNRNNNNTAVVEKRYPSLVDTNTLTTENIALLTESSRKIGRFELTGGSTTTTTTTSSVDVTPRGSISSSSHHHQHHQHHQQLNDQGHGHGQSHLSIDSSFINPQYQIEELLRFNENQRLILQELSLSFKKANHGSEEPYFVEQPSR